jgi:drug/metabolite transporter (DMT)-like permease
MADASTPVAKENFSSSKPRLGGGVIPFIALLVGNAALATGPLFVRLADVGPVAAGFWRLFLALPILLLLAFRETKGQPAGQLKNVPWGLAIMAGLFFAADLGSWHVGIHYTKMANATLFGNAASLMMAAATLIAARRWPYLKEALALGLAVLGAVLLMRESGQQGEARLEGDLLCLLAGLLYTGYMLGMQRARGSMGPWQALTTSSLAGVLPLLLVAFLLSEQIMPHAWLPVLALALTSQIIGQGLLIYALPHFSALVVGLTLLTQPAMSALIGWIIYNEKLGPQELVGAVLVAVALVMIRLPGGKSKAAPDDDVEHDTGTGPDGPAGQPQPERL